MRNFGSRQNLEGWRRKKTAPAPPVPKTTFAAASASHLGRPAVRYGRQSRADTIQLFRLDGLILG
jgi:hypothetical protein